MLTLLYLNSLNQGMLISHAKVEMNLRLHQRPLIQSMMKTRLKTGQLSLLTQSLPLQFEKHKVEEIGYSLKKVEMKLSGEIIL